MICGVAAFVAEQLLFGGMDDEMIVEAMLPLESFATKRTHVVRGVRMLRSV